MKGFEAVASGIVGTALMTAFLYALSSWLQVRLQVIHVLGTMLTFSTTRDGEPSTRPDVLAVGTAAHFGVGILFSCIYFFLATRQILVGVPGALVFGVAAGVFGAMVWRVFFALHPRPPKISLAAYLVGIMLSHVIFAAGMYATFATIVV